MRFSQNQEEDVILKYFEYLPVGTFLSVGENDGQTLSNVRALAEKGWHGVCIEPDPTPFAKLRKLYPLRNGKVYCYPYALSDHTLKNYELWVSDSLLGTGDTGLVSTHYDIEKSRFDKSVKYNKIEVQSYTWKTYYNRFKIKYFDFISIDAEGEDINILKQMDLDELQAKMVCVEWNSVPVNKEKFDDLFKGWKLVYTSGENLIYTR